MAAIPATSTSNTDSSVSPDVRPFPAPYLTPAGTTTSDGFCPVSPRLAAGAVGAATRQHNRHPGRPPRIRTTTFPPRPPRLRDDPVGDDGLYLLEQAHPDRPASYAVRVPRCRDPPRASFPPRLTTTQLPPARSQHHLFLQGTFTPKRSPMPGVLKAATLRGAASWRQRPASGLGEVPPSATAASPARLAPLPIGDQLQARHVRAAWRRRCAIGCSEHGPRDQLTRSPRLREGWTQCDL
jgi:hypothetical protein